MKLIFSTALVVSMACAGLTAHAGDPIEDPIIPRQAVVRLEAGFNIDDFNARYSARTLKSIGSRNIHLIEIPANEQQWLNAVLADDPAGMRWVELNYGGQDGEGRTGSFYVSGFRSGQLYRDQYVIDRINLPAAQGLSRGEGIRVAILDTGIDPTHPDLASRIGSGGYNFVNDSNDTRDLADGIDNDDDGDVDESHGHGTFIAGLVVLAAPEVELLPIVVLNSDGHGTGFQFAAGLFHAIDQGADVVNMSLGSTYDGQAMKDAQNEARLLGVTIVGAAGNQNVEDPEEHPATVEGAMGIAATNESDRKANFSNYHRKLSLVVPGTGIHSTIPITAEGHRYAEWEGTSHSTALVSGVAALILAAHPEWSDEVRALAVQDVMEASAREIDDPLFDDDMLGAGLLDAGAAIVEQPEAVQLKRLDLRHGTYWSGGLESLLDSADDDAAYYVADSDFGFQATDPVWIDLRIRATSTDTNPRAIELTIIDRTDQPNGTSILRLRDYANGGLREVASYPIALQDRERLFRITNAGRYVRNRDGRIELHVRHVMPFSFTVGGFVSHFDQVEFELD